jgi:geranylgeranyl pyrophosphate synthase
LSKTTTIFNLVQEGLKRVEEKMQESPRLRGSPGAPDQAIHNNFSTPHPVLDTTINQLVESGGKRVRPTLALLVNRIYPAAQEHTISLAAAVELLHTATLVHDDLIDGALLRRGAPTLNATWSPGATVLTGDYLFARAADLAAQTNSIRVMHLFAHTLMVICSGEVNQMFNKQASQSRQHYYERIFAKTAALFAVATEAAGILGNAPESIVTDLRRYGEQLGMAFQIVDDVLDFVGDENKVGKPVGSDLRAGLVTLPTLWYLEQHEDENLIHDVLSNGRRDRDTIQEAVETIRESGAIQAVLEEARQFIQNSQEALKTLPSGKDRDALWALADFVVDRNW